MQTIFIFFQHLRNPFLLPTNFANIASVFGREPLFWLLPISPLAIGDGYHFRINNDDTSRSTTSELVIDLHDRNSGNEDEMIDPASLTRNSLDNADANFDTKLLKNIHCDIRSQISSEIAEDRVINDANLGWLFFVHSFKQHVTN